MEEKCIDIFLSDCHYIQRTPTSKILKINNKEQVLEKYESQEDLPIQIKNIIKLEEDIERHPENYFEYLLLDDNTLILTSFTRNAKNIFLPIHIKIPEEIGGYKVTELDAFLFSDTNIRSLSMSDNIRKIGDRMCIGCKNLYKVELSSNISRIPEFCFYNCKQLPGVKISNNITSIGESAFENTKFSGEISFLPELKFIGVCAFANCKFTEIRVSSETFIEPSAFSYEQILNLKTYSHPIPYHERKTHENIL